jgi:hypothetical protein
MLLGFFDGFCIAFSYVDSTELVFLSALTFPASFGFPTSGLALQSCV